MLTEMTYGFRRPRPQTGSPYLDGVLASTVFDLDATIAASYSGTGVTWANLVAAPADGSAQTAYDFYRGDGATSTTYPTFNGSAGSAAAYWSFDGGDYFRLKSGANTSFLNNLHKTTGGANFWVAMTIRPADGGSALGWFNTQSGLTGPGVRVEQSSTEGVIMRQRGDSANVDTTSATVTPGTDYIVIYSRDHTGGVTARWFNTATGTTQSSAFNTTTTNGALMHIGSRTVAAGQLPGGTRIYSFAMGNEYLDNTKAAALIAALGVRHGRSYV